MGELGTSRRHARIGLLRLVSIFAGCLLAHQVSAQTPADPPNPFESSPDGGTPDAGDPPDEHNPFAVTPDPNAGGEGHGDGTCVPDCEAGFACYHGQCISRCNPACPQNQVCGSDAQCHPDPGGCPSGSVRTASGTCASTTPPPPPCPQGMIRTAAGTCAPGGPPPNYGTPAPTYARPVIRSTPRATLRSRARTRGVVGLVGAALVLGTGFAAAAFHGQAGGCDSPTFDICYPPDHVTLPQLPLVGISLVSQVAFGILAAGGGRAARQGGSTSTKVFGILGWVTWAGSLAGNLAVFLSHAIAATDDEPSALPTGVMYLLSAIGGISLILFGLDGLLGASGVPDDEAAEDESATSAQWTPQLSIAPELTSQGVQGMRGTLGAHLTF